MKGFSVLVAVLLAVLPSLLLAAAGIAAAQDGAVVVAKRVRAGHQLRRRQPGRAEAASPPIAIPQQLAPPQEAFASFRQAAAPAAPVVPSACRLRLAKLAEFKPLPVLVGPGECGAADAVLLQSVMLPEQTKVALAPPATLRCTMAEEVARWLREDVAPAARKLGSPLRSLDDLDSYECRGRNRVRGAMLSEHGRANALDVRGLTLADGKVIRLTDVNVAKDWREAMRASACAHFTTVLGPGSDANHEEHIHLDLAERRGGYRLCEWDVREPAPPAAKVATRSEPAQSGPPAKIAATVPLPRPRPPPMRQSSRTRSRPAKLRARVR